MPKTLEGQHAFSTTTMENYFKNYVPCPNHANEPITNFCSNSQCLRFLCPECVETHSMTYGNHQIESIKTCIRKTHGLLQTAIAELEQQKVKHSFLARSKSSSAQDTKGELTNHSKYRNNKVLTELSAAKSKIIAEVNRYFSERESEILHKGSKHHQLEHDLGDLRTNLARSIKELRFLEKNLYDTSETVKTIKRANQINYAQMLGHFHEKIRKMDRALVHNRLKLDFNGERQQELKVFLDNLLKNQPQHYATQEHPNFASSGKVNLQNSHYPKQSVSSPNKEYLVNPPPLSVDRLMNKNSFLIDHPNFFEGEPFLHFFEISKSNLHVAKIRTMHENKQVEWEVIPLSISFQIPSFHRTIATQEGNIYLIGGTDSVTLKKTNQIYQYMPNSHSLKPIQTLSQARSSHTLVCLNKLIYVCCGMGNEEVLASLEVFNPKINKCQSLAECKHPTVNSCLASIPNSEKLLKLGGMFENGENNTHIELYDIVGNIWVEIDPVIDNLKGDFSLLSCSGWGVLNSSQIFIFGGYDEENADESSNTTFVVEYDKEDNEYLIKHINLKNLPIAEGFWNPQAINYNSKIYVLQNVDGEEGGDCLEDRRNVLIFNGKNWEVGM